MSVTLTQVHNAILARLREKFPKATVESYNPEESLSVLAPALLLELEEFDPGDDAGDDRLPAQCRFSIHCVLGWEVKNLALEIREFAAAVVMLVRNDGIWLKGSVLTKPKQIGAYPGNFRKDMNSGYDSWVVSWEQTVYLGESVWTAEGVTPQQVHFAYAPGGKTPPINEYDEITDERNADN